MSEGGRLPHAVSSMVSVQWVMLNLGTWAELGRVTARSGAPVSHGQAVGIVIRPPSKPAPLPQHHRRVALSDDLAHDQNPAAVVGTRVARSASVRNEKRAVERRILVGDDWRRVGHCGAPFSKLSR